MKVRKAPHVYRVPPHRPGPYNAVMCTATTSQEGRTAQNGPGMLTSLEQAGVTPPRLMLLRSEYRLIHDPLLRLIQQLEMEFPERGIAVMLPEVVKTAWWQRLLHTHRARRLRAKLLRYGGSKLGRGFHPLVLEEPRIDEGIYQTTADPLNAPQQAT